MTAKNINEAWEIANRMFAAETIEDADASAAGYRILRSVDGTAWISDLGSRLEVNLSDGGTVNIWIENEETRAARMPMAPETGAETETEAKPEAKPKAKREVEVSRSNVTLAEFFRYVRKRCEKAGLEGPEIDMDDFVDPVESSWGSTHYTSSDGVRHMMTSRDGIHFSEWTMEVENDINVAETSTVFPCSYQSCTHAASGYVTNEIMEFSYDDENRGTGYYYRLVVDPERAVGGPKAA